MYVCGGSRHDQVKMLESELPEMSCGRAHFRTGSDECSAALEMECV